VLTGAGDKAFCAGGDLKEMADTALTVPPPDFAPQFGRNIEIPKPTIAAVNGVAWAGGFLLAQSCDLCVAAENATFAISEVKVGRGAPWAAPLSWLIPPRIALQILLTGDPITAARACEVGLVNEVVPLAELRSRTQELAERIAANAPLSVLAAKRTAYLSRPEKFDEAERIWAPVYHSADAQEGPAAFRDKRKPVWTGRLPQVFGDVAALGHAFCWSRRQRRMAPRTAPPIPRPVRTAILDQSGLVAGAGTMWKNTDVSRSQ
jgi:enoyl-CoA hydratase/carnithine racemase